MWLCHFFGSWYTQYHDYLSVTFRYMRVMIILLLRRRKERKAALEKERVSMVGMLLRTRC